MSADYFGACIGLFWALGFAWTVAAFFLWDFIPITKHNTWHLWPIWAGPLIMVGSPLIVLALHIPLLPFLPCILLLRGPFERRQQRVTRTHQMEEGVRRNQRYMDAANAAEAARLAAEPAAAEPAAPVPAAPEPAAPVLATPEPAAAEPATPPEGGETGDSSPANDAKEDDTSTPNDDDTPRSVDVAEPESVEKPAAIPGDDITTTVAPPAPAHIDR